MSWRDNATPIKSEATQKAPGVGSWRDNATPIKTEEVSEPLVDPSAVLETAQDFGLGTAQGATLGTADELTGAAKAAYDVATTDKSLSDLQDLYSKYQQIEQDRYKAAEERSPWAYGGGRFAGSIVPGVGAAGAAARIIKPASTLSKLAVGALSGGTAGGVEGVASSESPIIGGTEQQRAQALQAGKSSAMLGALLGGALETTTGKAIGGLAAAKAGADKLAESSSYIGQMGKAFNEGLEGKLLTTKGAEKAGYIAEREAAERLGGELTGAVYKLSGEVDDVLQQASKSGVRVKTSAELDGAISTVNELINTNQAARLDPKVQKVNKYLSKLTKNELDPVEARDLVRQISDLAAPGRDSNPGYTRTLQDAAGKFRKALGDQVPGYNEVAETFSKFSSSGPERLIGERVSDAGTPAELKEAVRKELEKFIEKLGMPGATKANAVKDMDDFMKGLKELNAKRPDIYAKSGLAAPEVLEKTIIEFGDRAGMMRQMHAPSSFNDFGVTSRGKSYSLANIAGRSVKGAKDLGEAAVSAVPKAFSEPATSAVNIGKRLYDASDEVLQNVATKLSGVKELAPKGEALAKAIATKNRAQRNAILFSILQSPAARGILAEDQ